MLPAPMTPSFMPLLLKNTYQECIPLLLIKARRPVSEDQAAAASSSSSVSIPAGGFLAQTTFLP